MLGLGEACALSTNGFVSCWGATGSTGAQGSGEGPVVRVPVYGVHAIATEGIQICALDGDGARCWGGHVPANGRQVRTDGPRLVRDTRGAVALRAVPFMMCAVWTDGAERCWSTNVLPLRRQAVTQSGQFPAFCGVQGLVHSKRLPDCFG